ncbi:MAG: alpha/beta fold hydrolase [Pseudomonadota bacterium]
MPATAISLPVTATSSEGPETAPPLVIAHGLFGQARNFASLAKRFAAGRRVLTVDMRNHGEAPHAEPMDYPAMAADLASVIAGEAGGRAVLLGHSMGGKAAMTLALSYPDCLAALIVADIAPVAYEHYEHGSILGALRAADLSGVTRRSEADPILAPDIPDPGIRAFILQNLAVDREGARWRPGLAEIEAGMPAILGFPEDFLEPAFEGPTLFLHGAASHYVLPEHHPRIRALFPDAEIEALPGAGHWLHAEKPDAFHAAVTRFLETL